MLKSLLVMPNLWVISMKKIDMTLGSPDLHAEVWDNTALPRPKLRGLGDGMPYIKTGSLKNLPGHIIDAHLFDGNVSNLTDKTRIVLGAGATQLLMATLQYFNKEGLRLPRPSWFRIDDMAKMRNCRLNTGPHALFSLVTCPNNPDGNVSLSQHPLVVYDAVYNWKHYFYTSTKQPVINLDECVGALFSLSKYTGHAGSRVGWLLTNDEMFADFVENYVEFDSSGVSVDAQWRALDVLPAFIDLSIKEEVRRRLQDRFIQMAYVCHKHNLTLHSTCGMFAWVEGAHALEFFADRGVSVMRGSRFHADDTFCRLNMAVDSSTWENFFNAVA